MVLTRNYRFFWQISPNTEICSDFYEIWNPQETKQSKMLILIMSIILTYKCLENLRDYRLITWNYNMNYYYMKIDSQSEHD